MIMTNIETKLEDLKREATNAYVDYKSDRSIRRRIAPLEDYYVLFFDKEAMSIVIKPKEDTSI